MVIADTWFGRYFVPLRWRTLTWQKDRCTCPRSTLVQEKFVSCDTLLMCVETSFLAAVVVRAFEMVLPPRPPPQLELLALGQNNYAHKNKGIGCLGSLLNIISTADTEPQHDWRSQTLLGFSPNWHLPPILRRGCGCWELSRGTEYFTEHYRVVIQVVIILGILFRNKPNELHYCEEEDVVCCAARHDTCKPYRVWLSQHYRFRWLLLLTSAHAAPLLSSIPLSFAGSWLSVMFCINFWAVLQNVVMKKSFLVF